MKEIRISDGLWSEVDKSEQEKILKIIKESGFFEDGVNVKIVGDTNISAEDKVTLNIEVDRNEWFGCKIVCDTAAAAAAAACTTVSSGVGVAACIAAANAAREECRDRC